MYGPASKVQAYLFINVMHPILICLRWSVWDLKSEVARHFIELHKMTEILYLHDWMEGYMTKLDLYSCLIFMLNKLYAYLFITVLMKNKSVFLSKPRHACGALAQF